MEDLRHGVEDARNVCVVSAWAPPEPLRRAENQRSIAPDKTWTTNEHKVEVLSEELMLRSNGYYGHREIFCAYAGVPNGTPIPGQIQHGWNYDLGTSPEGIAMSAPEPYFLWSKRNLENCRQAGLGHQVVPLGAPFLYLPPATETIVAEAGTLLVMPFHGWEKERIASSFNRYAQMLRDIARDFRKIIVCMYWHDHGFAEYRRPFEDLGAEVLTIGHRDENPRFLLDLRRLLLRCEYVTANRVQTAAFYSLYLRRKFFVYGPPAGLDNSVDRSGELFHAWQKQEFPHLFWETFGDACHSDTAERELGLEYVRTPGALRELFSWEPGARAALERRISAHRDEVERRRRERRIERWRQRVSDLVPGWVQARLSRRWT